MKYLIASDLHGSVQATRKVIEAFRQHKADKLILLGDLYYHGPRNALPYEYNPKEVAALLNGIKDVLLVTRGNCDADVDLMISEFEFLPHLLLEADGLRLFFSHGNVYDPQNPPNLPFDIMFYGHFHVGIIGKTTDFTYANPGSATFSNPPSYVLYENGQVSLREL